MEDCHELQKDYNILITGATGNIGSAAMSYFSGDKYWKCTGIARRSDREDVSSLDLSKSWNELRYWCRSRLEKYDVVLMAHGTQKPAMLLDMNEDDWLNILYGNLSSAIGFTQALVKEDKINDGGLIVFCSSIQANTPRSGRGLYGACKAGLEAFSKTVAVELAPRRIRSVALRLGQLTHTMKDVNFSHEEYNILQKRTLTGFVNPRDVAKLVYDLYWQPNLTGCTIDYDGGHGVNIW